MTTTRSPRAGMRTILATMSEGTEAAEATGVAAEISSIR
jgi:hypothetical protein